MLRKPTWASPALCIATSVTLMLLAPAPAPSQNAAIASIGGSAIQPPAMFVENRGQLEADTSFYTLGSDVMATFSNRGVVLALTDSQGAIVRTNERPFTPAEEVLPTRHERKPSRRFEVEFTDARSDASPVGRLPRATRISSFTGSRDRWRSDLRAYGEIVYENLWPGIDLVYSAATGSLKYRFEVKPGADPRQIRLAYKDSSTLRIAGDGALEAVVAGELFRDEAPVSWQLDGAKRSMVSSSYALVGDGSHGFTVGRYDPSRTLIIDPEVFAYATYIGNRGADRGLGLALDGLGRVYVTGRIKSALTFSSDIYMARLNAAGTAFEYFTVIGGAGDDEAYDIVVDAAGNAYATGYTDSDETSFPVTVGPDLTYNLYGDVFVTKLNEAGTDLIYLGYIGGQDLDFGEGIAVDAFGNVVVTGVASGGYPGFDTFPAVVGPDTTHNGGVYDCFVSKVKAVPDAPVVEENFIFSGFIGGDAVDIGLIGSTTTAGHIALDSAGNAYISGMTFSRESTFPDGDGFGSIPGFDQVQGNPEKYVYDAFVVKVWADGTGLAFATYIGGSSEDYAWGMAVDAAGNSYFTGLTESDQESLPVRVGPDLTYNGRGDAMVGKLDPTGTNLLFLGYIGGTDTDGGNGLDIDAEGNVFVVGYAESPNFPVVNGPDLTFNGIARGGRALFNMGDAFVVKVKANPSSDVVTENFEFSTYIGGLKNDWAFWGRVDNAGNFWVIGDTQSSESTFPDGDGFGSVPGLDQTFAEGSTRQSTDAFLIKLVAQ
jgi:hypothetical protein